MTVNWRGDWKPISTAASSARTERSSSLIQERGVAPSRRGIHRQRALAREAVKVMRAAGLRSRPRQPGPAERLYADHGTDHIAGDVRVADGSACECLSPECLQA